jgi:hypothetical protein
LKPLNLKKNLLPKVRRFVAQRIRRMGKTGKVRFIWLKNHRLRRAIATRRGTLRVDGG